MTNEFTREDRYIVFKTSDLENSTRGNEIRRLAREYAEQRRLKGKKPLECVVVEKDWPEYEPTWRAIEARVTGAQPAPSVPDGWLRAVDEALVTAHIGVANASDTYEQAKAKLDNLIGFHVGVATDPAVNGGWKLMPAEPTQEIYKCFAAYDGSSYSNPFDFDDFREDYLAAINSTGLPVGAKLYALPGAQPAPSVPECPYPCGWRNLLKYALVDGSFLARSINEDEPVSENGRAVTMRMVMRLRDVLMAINNAAPESKP